MRAKGKKMDTITELPPLFRERPFIEGPAPTPPPLQLRDRRSFGSGLSLRAQGAPPGRDRRAPPLFRERPFIEGSPVSVSLSTGINRRSFGSGLSLRDIQCWPRLPLRRVPPLFRERPFIEGGSGPALTTARLTPPLFRERPFIEGETPGYQAAHPPNRRSFGSGLSSRDYRHSKCIPGFSCTAALSGAAFH